MKNLKHECSHQGCFMAKHGIDFTGLTVLEKRPKIMPSDLDWIVEINGRFLVQEWKSDGLLIDVNSGQHRMLAAMSKVPRFTVMYVFRSAEDTQKVVAVQFINDGKLMPRKDCGHDRHVAGVQAWAALADR